jgi:hypothetical protein
LAKRRRATHQAHHFLHAIYESLEQQRITITVVRVVFDFCKFASTVSLLFDTVAPTAYVNILNAVLA